MKRRVPRFELEDDAVTGINVTPLVDVCLVLVIIFMVATPMMSQPAFDVKLPQAKTKEGQEEDKVTISLGSDGRVALDSQEFTDLEAMQKALKAGLAATESGLVVIRADREATHGRLTDLMGRAKAAGARSLTVATEQRKE
ncbi:MAG: TonB system transport protein ExbD2 [Elusimicrobia bacterium]|nr:MAG: TonB system transport protein ExbD2 [Elusimicrobiota bacterium]